jgi:hypothetical protein
MNGQAGTISVLRPAAAQVLAVALGLSLLAHLFIYGGYRVVKHLNWTGYDQVVARLMPKSSHLTPAILKWFLPKPKPQVKREELKPLPREITMVIQPTPPPMTFLPVDPMQATVEEPPNAKFYSDKNSLAANPEIKKESDQPNIDGKQKNVPRTLDTRPQNFVPTPVQNPQPRPPDKKAAEEKTPDTEEGDVAKPAVPAKPAKPSVEPKPKGGQAPGNLAMGKPVEKPSLHDGQAPDTAGPGEEKLEPKPAEPAAKATRPRTLVEARSRMQDNTIAGQKMQQEGGVKNRLVFSALDAKATPFGAYDNAIVSAIQARWYDLLERSRYSGDKRGHVVIEFRLYSTGRVADLKISDNTVGDFLASLCQSAVMDPAPYPKWPPEMQRMFSGGFRDVRFSFFYD